MIHRDLFLTWDLYPVESCQSFEQQCSLPKNHDPCNFSSLMTKMLGGNCPGDSSGLFVHGFRQT